MGQNVKYVAPIEVPTWQSRSANPPLLLLVIERLKVTNCGLFKKTGRKRKRKRNMESTRRRKQTIVRLKHKINFRTKHLKFDGFKREYDVIATIQGGDTGNEGHFWC